MMAHPLPPALAQALGRLDAARRQRAVRWREAGVEPRQAAPASETARHLDPGDAAKTSLRALRQAIKGELPWWVRD